MNSSEESLDYGAELYLTPFIRTKRIFEAREKAKVKVGLNNAEAEDEESETIESYSGFLTVDENWNSNMFFWFFPAQVNVFCNLKTVYQLLQYH